MAFPRRTAILILTAAMFASPHAVFAQIPDLGDKVGQLIAEVREQGSEMRPLYQEEFRTEGEPAHQQPKSPHAPERPSMKPAHATPGRSSHAAPASR
jgi:hypothetical protein